MDYKHFISIDWLKEYIVEQLKTSDNVGKVLDQLSKMFFAWDKYVEEKEKGEIK